MDQPNFEASRLPENREIQKHDKELTKRQAEIMMAIENSDRNAFVSLGGATGAELNFELT